MSCISRAVHITSLGAACKDEWPIHREAPSFAEQSVEQEILITGIKVRTGRPRVLTNQQCRGMTGSGAAGALADLSPCAPLASVNS